MILVDTALRQRAAAGNPVRVAMVGTGFMGRGGVLQILSVVPGMRLVAIATAKHHLRAGEVLGGPGRYMTYGQCKNAAIVHRQNLQPLGVAEGCRVRQDIPTDQVLTYAR
jgi:predicted homoserine dehydrogenase-like protein